MKQFILNILFWLMKKLGAEVMTLSDSIRLLIPEAEAVVVEVEQMPGLLSGEYRFSVALGKLWKRHPEASKRDCALAIEIAIYNGVI